MGLRLLCNDCWIVLSKQYIRRARETQFLSYSKMSWHKTRFLSFETEIFLSQITSCCIEHDTIGLYTFWIHKTFPKKTFVSPTSKYTEKHFFLQFFMQFFLLLILFCIQSIKFTWFRSSPWCNGYRRRKWTRRHEFKSWPRLIAFHIALILSGKVWIQSFSLQLWVNSRAD